MKHLFGKLMLAAVLAGVAPAAKGQSMADEVKTSFQHWKYDFSEEGRKAWKAEITVRMDGGIYHGGPSITGGIRIDEKRTIGLMLGHREYYSDHIPCTDYVTMTALYYRRYQPLGKKQIFGLYSEVTVGGAFRYASTRPADTKDNFTLSPLQLGWEGGVRIRFWRNIHIFLGPTFSTTSAGIHAGFGF